MPWCLAQVLSWLVTEILTGEWEEGFPLQVLKGILDVEMAGPLKFVVSDIMTPLKGLPRETFARSLAVGDGRAFPSQDMPLLRSTSISSVLHVRFVKLLASDDSTMLGHFLSSLPKLLLAMGCSNFCKLILTEVLAALNVSSHIGSICRYGVKAVELGASIFASEGSIGLKLFED